MTPLVRYYRGMDSSVPKAVAFVHLHMHSA
jgi:hypothetical protein